MLYRKLGNSGLPVSVLSFGSWVTFGKQIDTSQSKKYFSIAYDAGVNFFDNAEVYEYGNAESIMGAAFKDLGWERSSYIVSSKAFFGDRIAPLPTQCGLHRKHLIEACHSALKRLQLNYLDLFFCHRPDLSTPMREVVETMTMLIQQGKILYWGTSEWTASQITYAIAIAREFNLIAPITEQPQYNLLHRNRVENEYSMLYKEFRYGITAWSPLASGFLSGKYNNGIPQDSRVNLPGYEWLKKLLIEKYGPSRLKVIKRLGDLANSLGISLARFSIAWCIKNPAISSVILGASKTSQLIENIKAIDDVKLLTEKVFEKVNNILSRIPNTLSHGNEGS